MIRRTSGSSRLALIGGIGGVLVVAAAIAGVLVVKSKHAAYVRETLAILPQAEQAYENGRFADAATTAAGASTRHKANPTWFELADEKRIQETEKFFASQLYLWNR